MDIINYVNNEATLNISTISDILFFNYYSLATKTIINVYKTIYRKKNIKKTTNLKNCKAHIHIRKVI